MKFALLGVDDELLALVRGIFPHKEHQLVAIFEPGEHAYALHALAPSARTGEEWESLLLTGAVDVVLVGRTATSADARADQLKKLAQAKVPLVVLQPGCEYIDGYEVEMIRRDVDGVIIPYYPGIFQPEVYELALLTGGTANAKVPGIGAFEQLVIERRMTVRTRELVLAQLARDVDLVRRLLGNINQVSASGKVDDARPPITLGVQLTSEHGVLSRWSVGPADANPGATVTLVGAEGKIQLELPEQGDGRWIINGESKPLAARRDEARLLIDLVQQAITTGNTRAPTWQDACRAAEIPGTVPRCLARGKTIELYNEEHTEDGAFKGTMAVGGCLLILFGLLAVVSVAVVEGLQLPLHDYFLWRIWPVYLLTPIVAFLLLQVVGVLARRK